MKKKPARGSGPKSISGKRLTSAVCVLLALCTLAVFWQVRTHDFISYDDPDYVTKNPHIRDGVTLRGIEWAFGSVYAANWHPLTWVSHMMDVQMYGLDPAGHHLTNLWIHVANTLLLFVTLKRMTNRLWPSAFVAALFALHPLHTESVAWVAERKDVLSAFFWILTMWLYVRYTETRSAGFYAGGLVSLGLGLLAKQMLVTLPFVLLLLDYWPLGRLKWGPAARAGEKGKTANPAGGPSWSFVVKEKLPFVALAAAASVTIFIVQQSAGVMSSRDLLPLGARISNAVVSYAVYAGKTIWPSNLAVFYPHPGNTLSPLTVGAAALFLLLVTALAVWNAKRFPFLLVGWFWYLGTLVPVIGLVQVGIQARADRYTYLPIIGLFIIIAWGCTELFSNARNRTTALGAGGAVVLGVCMILTFAQADTWKSNTALFSHAVEVIENNYLAHNDLGSALEKEGKADLAISHYREAIRLKPDFVLAHSNLGAALGKQGKYDEAIAHLSEAIRLKPDHADAHNNLGIIYAIQGKSTDAEREFSEAVRIEPDHADAHYNLGFLLAGQGKLEEAIIQYERTLEINPGQENARVALADVRRALEKRGPGGR